MYQFKRSERYEGDLALTKKEPDFLTVAPKGSTHNNVFQCVVSRKPDTNFQHASIIKEIGDKLTCLWSRSVLILDGEKDMTKEASCHGSVLTIAV